MKRLLIFALLFLAACAPPTPLPIGGYTNEPPTAPSPVSVVSLLGPYYRITDLENKVVCWGTSDFLTCKTFEELGR